MLYNLMPPTILLLSLGGVMVILSRGVLRMRKAEFNASIKSYGNSTTTTVNSSKNIGRLFRPTHKGVQAISNRATGAMLALKQNSQEISQGFSGLKSRLSNRRIARKQDSPAPAPEPTETVATSPAKGELVMPESGWRDKFSSSVSNAFGSARHRAHKSVTALKERRQQRQIDQESNTKDTPAPTPKKLSIKTRLVQSRVSTEESRLSSSESSGSGLSLSAVVKKAVTASVSASTAPTPAEPVTLLGQAQAALTAKDFKKAEFFVLNHITKHTKDCAAYMLLGQIALAQSNWSEGLEIFEQIISWNDQQPGAYSALGYAACRAGKLTRAIQALQRAHEAEPENIAVLQDLYIIARRMDNPALQHSISKKLEALNAPVVSSHADVVAV